MNYGNRCLMVHGHFYQPPRENPWTGVIEPQKSAYPWENWNQRIADECYIPMTRSRVYNKSGEVTELYNNYAHTSFNFGPTLLSWLADNHPALVGHLRDAAVIDRTFAMAQPYNHMMMPLADTRDRHTQVVWGLREFYFRFGFHPVGMWLPECGIDRETMRVLVDHGVKYAILSPHQASKARPFGEREWRDASMGGIDTRRAYRLFEIDGAGRTHFDRHLDIIFYTPGLNLKVSFDHILNRPADLMRELENCYLQDYDGAQLVSVVTDGEIYGHHEKGGEEALTRLFRDIAPKLGLRVVSAAEFVREHPPAWEVKLWEGEDGNGSSWSCQHGMGRWSRNCGCTPPAPPGWTQTWRPPLRDAFDQVRGVVRDAMRRELGAILWDADEARDDYITVVLSPDPATRRDFIRRHAQRELSPAEAEKLWRLLEASHNAMLAYTSCGWFFDEISGLEPVQNMRYALRALELAAPYCGDGAIDDLEAALAKAPSNLPRFGDGGAVFRELVLPTRFGNRSLAAAMALCLAANLPTDSLNWELLGHCPAVHFSDTRHVRVAWGAFVCRDPQLDRIIRTSWIARLDDLENIGVGLHGYEELQGDPNRGSDEGITANGDFFWLNRMRDMDLPALTQWFEENGFTLARIPESVRIKLYREFAGGREDELIEEVTALGARAVPFLSRAHRYGAEAPASVVKVVATAFEREIDKAVLKAVADLNFSAARLKEAERVWRTAEEMGIRLNPVIPRRALEHFGLELLHWLTRLADRDWLAGLASITLHDGSEWLAPQAKANRQYAYPSGHGAALIGGRSMAMLRHRLMRHENPAVGALLTIPAPELLSFARRAGLDWERRPALGIAYWEFLEKALPRIIRPDPAGLMAGTAGDRVRDMGRELGFSEEAVAKRILAAARARDETIPAGDA